jgi:hypothetical protein
MDCCRILVDREKFIRDRELQSYPAKTRVLNLAARCGSVGIGSSTLVVREVPSEVPRWPTTNTQLPTTNAHPHDKTLPNFARPRTRARLQFRQPLADARCKMAEFCTPKLGPPFRRQNIPPCHAATYENSPQNPPRQNSRFPERHALLYSPTRFCSDKTRPRSPP